MCSPSRIATQQLRRSVCTGPVWLTRTNIYAAILLKQLSSRARYNVVDHVVLPNPSIGWCVCVSNDVADNCWSYYTTWIPSPALLITDTAYLHPSEKLAKSANHTTWCCLSMSIDLCIASQTLLTYTASLHQSNIPANHVVCPSLSIISAFVHA